MNTTIVEPTAELSGRKSALKILLEVIFLMTVAVGNTAVGQSDAKKAAPGRQRDCIHQCVNRLWGEHWSRCVEKYQNGIKCMLDEWVVAKQGLSQCTASCPKSPSEECMDSCKEKAITETKSCQNAANNNRITNEGFKT